MQEFDPDHAYAYHSTHEAELAAAEARRGRNLHGPFHSFHEGWGVMQEELEELFDEIRVKNPSYESIHTEAIQVAAMALRIAVCARRKMN